MAENGVAAPAQSPMKAIRIRESLVDSSTAVQPSLIARPKPKPRRLSLDLTSSDSDDSALLTLSGIAKRKMKRNSDEKDILSDILQEPPSKRARVYSMEGSPAACSLPSRDIDQICNDVLQDQHLPATEVDKKFSISVPQFEVNDYSARKGEQLFDMLEEQLDDFNNWLQDNVV